MTTKQIKCFSETQELTVKQIKRAVKELKKANNKFLKGKKYIILPKE